ncbi:MAG TPA: 2-hydroxyacid dehydrogenase [Acetobacteraceae bacterium]|nr:2-hydroxyacid dehydrogenase [Acetobacteraceae bacterium]
MSIETVVVLDPISEATADRLRAFLPPGMVLTHGTARGDDHLRAIIAEAEYAISGQVAVSGDVLRAARRLKLLHKWGVGVDNLDIDAARALGIQVARTTGSNALPVAEFTIGLMIATMRHLAYGHAELKRGQWRGGRLPGESFLLSGKTVGLVGFGAIGRNVARLLAGFGCTILYHKPTPLAAEEEVRLGISYAMMPELLARADIVSLHCPLTPQTAGLIDRTALRAMKRTAVLINVARGGVVDEADLARALRAGDIMGAATDVFETEPPPADHPLLALDNAVVTPHLAAGAADNFAPTVGRMFDNIARVARGEAVPESDCVVGPPSRR